jgi:hypothetical protein
MAKDSCRKADKRAADGRNPNILVLSAPSLGSLKMLNKHCLNQYRSEEAKIAILFFFLVSVESLGAPVGALDFLYVLDSFRPGIGSGHPRANIQSARQARKDFQIDSI